MLVRGRSLGSYLVAEPEADVRSLGTVVLRNVSKLIYAVRRCLNILVNVERHDVGRGSPL